MSRVFKFRIWHKVEKRFLDPWAEEDPTLCLKDFGKGCEVYLHDRESGESSNKHCQMDDIVIQQWTGLKDAKDDDIYEGDIINEYHFGDNLKYQVKWTDDLASFWKVNTKGVMINLCDGYLLEVIGNIFETPEAWEGRLNHEKTN